MKTVKDLLKEMKREVCSILPKATVFEALKIMGEKEIGCLMVIDEKNKVSGILSERDYARKVILQGKTSRETLGRRDHDTLRKNVHDKTRDHS